MLEGTFDGQGSLFIPLLHLVTELVSVVELLYLIKIGLITPIAATEGRKKGRTLL